MAKPMVYVQKAFQGARVFVHDDAPYEVHEFFKQQSIWKGCDKSGDNYRSYEIENEWSWMKERGVFEYFDKDLREQCRQVFASEEG